MKKIYIDAGHGGYSTGATYKGRKEQDDCLRLAKAVKALLDTQQDIEVRLSRETDINPSISQRTSEANSWGADYFISIHRNAVSPNVANGVEGWCYSKIEKGGVTYNYAKNIVDKVCEATGFNNRGIRLGAPNYTDFGVNRMTKMSSVLLEAGFIDSDKDNMIFDTAFSEMALAIAKALTENVGLTYNVPVIKGDADGDGKITAADARLILRASVGLESIDLNTGDMDSDGKITANDAREALKKSVEGE